MPPQTTLTAAQSLELLAPLARLGSIAISPALRQPVHTVYGGAHLFKRNTAKRIGELALAAMDSHDFGQALGLGSSLELRVREKIQREAVEDFRLDFEDGFGPRSEAEEDEAAVTAARETAAAVTAGTLPPFFGIRIKALGPETRQRSLRTLDLYLTALLGASPLPVNFVVTLPKVNDPAEVKVLVAALRLLESVHHCGPISIEVMIETPRSLFSSAGTLAPPLFFLSAEGRLRGAHFGAYDFTSALGIAAPEQSLAHPACSLARQLMQLGFADTQVWLSDGATSVLPVPPHRAPVSEQERSTNREAVQVAWRLAFLDVRRSLRQGFYQGWDLHPAQLPARYAALYSFFAEGLESATERLRNFVDKAARATLNGSVFDDAATGQGLLNFFLRGLACGALSEVDVEATGLTQEELRTRSFEKIVAGRGVPR